MRFSKTLLIGPRYSKCEKAVGGVVVLFEGLIEYCSYHNRDVIIIDTNMSNYRSIVGGFISVITDFFVNISRVNHISLHGTAKDYLYLAPIFVCASKICGKKISLRKFAGNFNQIYSDSNFIKRKLFNVALKNADVLFFETKHLVNKFKRFNNNTYWWPNSRKSNFHRKNLFFNKRFIFLSQVKRSKGIMEFIEVAEALDNSYVFDVFGPVLEEDLYMHLAKSEKVNYRGVLRPEEVPKTLINYDVLILPTYHHGEGYPGIILECFSCGIPVISTNWNAIPELIQNDFNGFLVQIKKVDEILRIIKSLNKDTYEKYSVNSLSSFTQFEHEAVHQNVFDIIEKSI